MLQARLTLWSKTLAIYIGKSCGPNGCQEQTFDPDLLEGVTKLKKREAKGG